jgi:hypothetical protein
MLNDVEHARKREIDFFFLWFLIFSFFSRVKLANVGNYETLFIFVVFLMAGAVFFSWLVEIMQIFQGGF